MTAEQGIFLGMWADARKDYLKKACPDEYEQLVKDGTLQEDLLKYQEIYEEKADRLTEQKEAAEGVTEDLKRENWYEWTTRAMRIHSEVRQEMIREIYHIYE